MRVIQLFDGIGPANAAFDSGVLDVSSFDAILVQGAPSGVAAASIVSFRDPDFDAALNIGSLATPATASAWSAACGFAVASAASPGNNYLGGTSGGLPARIRVLIGPLGVGITCHLRVLGVRSARHY